VFEREGPGFAAFGGNPPFVGGRKGRGSLSSEYFDWLGAMHAESSGNADLVAHFFRRAFDLLREGGAFGLIATNTIGQGDTRATGLRWICTHGGHIFTVRKRVKWPGMAAVVVSVVHAMKGSFEGTKCLDGHEVERITAFLFHRGGDADPARLIANEGKSFQGSIVLGMGFTFDDTDTRLSQRICG
jgi:MmeI, DNA-methyltransferase domain